MAARRASPAERPPVDPRDQWVLFCPTWATPPSGRCSTLHRAPSRARPRPELRPIFDTDASTPGLSPAPPPRSGLSPSRTCIRTAPHWHLAAPARLLDRQQSSTRATAPCQPSWSDLRNPHGRLAQTCPYPIGIRAQRRRDCPITAPVAVQRSGSKRRSAPLSRPCRTAAGLNPGSAGGWPASLTPRESSCVARALPRHPSARGALRTAA